jgi:uncharacterized protein
MSIEYSTASRVLQDQFDTRRLADRLGAVKVHHVFSTDDRQFIERLDMLFIATVDATGQPTCSYKGGDPGFVSVVDDRTLAFPSYDGNGMFLTTGNVMECGSAGLLFIDFELQRRMRVDGLARITFDDPLFAKYPEAQFIVRVDVRRVYPNCPRYIHKYRLEERSQFVPHKGLSTPVPAWKNADWARDVLPAGDAARDP